MTPIATPHRRLHAGASPLALLALLALAAPGPAQAQAAPDPAAGQATPAAAPPAEPEAAKRVIFLPETYKRQLRDEIKRDVLEQARREGWASPDLVPARLSRFKFSGDFRGRFDRVIFVPGNANGGEFPDFNAINTNKAFDMKGVDLANDRYLNVDQSRSRPRIRARLVTGVELGEGWTFGMRLGTGEGSTPTSSNQTLGASGGLFSKYQVWLDRAFLKYQLGGERASYLAVLLGRFDNPFLGTDLLWWDDLGFDGAALKGQLDVGGGVAPFLNGGVFPVYTTGLGYPAERSDKFPSRNKWLYAAQLGLQWKAVEELTIKVGVAFYDFDQVEGRVTPPCDTNLKDITCLGDEGRPPFAQKGNSYMALRTPSAAALAAEASSLVPRYQFFGLASRFREAVATGRADLLLSPRLKLGLDAEYVRNEGFKRQEVAAVALNNRGPLQGSDPIGPFVGGNEGLLVRMSLGTPELNATWDWRVRFGYRQLGSDAVLDALNDPDFGQGGTNLKGYALDVALMVASRITASARWLSADQVSGPRYAVDVLQFDLAARF